MSKTVASCLALAVDQHYVPSLSYDCSIEIQQHAVLQQQQPYGRHGRLAAITVK